MDKYFDSVCELDVSPSLVFYRDMLLISLSLTPHNVQIMFHIEKAHYIVKYIQNTT